MMIDVDRIATMLADGARMGRSMPPAWDGARISVPVIGPDGQWIGRILPGRGLSLASDLKYFGITRPIPFVYERSSLERLQDVITRHAPIFSRRRYYHRGLTRIMDPERGAITTYDGIINGRANGKANDVTVSKTSITTVAQAFSSLFRAGGLPVAGTYTNIPGGAVHTRASTGAWSIGLSNPGTDKKYLLTFGFGSASAIDWGILVDLLVCAGNILATTTSAQTVNTTAQTRQYDATLGAGVMMTFEITTALSATAHNMTVNSYTDQDGNAASTTAAETGLSGGIVQRLVPVGLGPFMQLAAGDFGVRSVEQYTNSAALAAGVFALNLYFPLAFVPGVAANLYIERDSTVQIDGLTELVKDGSNVIGCLTMYVQTNGTTSGILKAFMRTVAG